MESKELEVAIDATMEAGKILLKYYGKVSKCYKPDKSLVTKADAESEETIKSILTKEFPNHSFLGEESGYDKAESDYSWIVDPLDGTTNYTIRNPFFDVSIALVCKEEPILGVVYYPYEGEIFYAEKNGGAHLNGKKIKVSDNDEIDKSILTFCHGNEEKDINNIINIFGKLKLTTSNVRQIGAAALELCYVACGRVESFLMAGVNPWDVAAGAIIVKEATGKVSNFDGNPFTMNSHDILASNGKIHDRLLGILRSY